MGGGSSSDSNQPKADPLSNAPFQTKQQVDKRLEQLIKKVDTASLAKGNVTGSGQNAVIATTDDKVQTNTAKFAKLFKADGQGPSKPIFTSMAAQMQSFAELARTTNLSVEQVKQFPLPTGTALTIIYFFFSMEKMIVNKDQTNQEQIVCMYVYRVIQPAQVKSRSQLAGYIAFTSLSEDQKKNAVDYIWGLYQETLSMEELTLAEAKAKKLAEIRQARNKNKKT